MPYKLMLQWYPTTLGLFEWLDAQNPIGNKNWLFSDSPAGATASATIYSIVEIAKAHNLNFYEYIKHFLSKRSYLSWTDE